MEILNHLGLGLYICPLVGLTVPALLILGNKSFGISGTLRHTCDVYVASIPFLHMIKEWNMFSYLNFNWCNSIFSFLSNPDPLLLTLTLEQN
jgi:hypothetical protein